MKFYHILTTFLLAGVSIGFTVPLMGQQTKLLTAEKHNEYGLVYSLPVTAFKVEIVAEKLQSVAGPFNKYAEIFISEKDVVSKDDVKWSISSVKVTPYGVPDTENRYLMQLKSGSTTFIEVADDGMIVSINKEIELPEQEEISFEAIEGEPTTGKEYLEFVDEDFLSAQSSFKKSQLLAEELMEIRDAKLSLTRGTAETMPTDGRQLEIMLGSLDKQEKSLINAFTGSKWIEREVRTFTVVPTDEGKYLICRFSPKEGFLTSDSKGGTPVNLEISKTREAKLPEDAKGEEKKVPKDAVMYCVPGYAMVSVVGSEGIIQEEEYPMSQFGMLFGLNPSIFTDKKEPSFAIFDPSTGALKELGVVK